MGPASDPRPDDPDRLWTVAEVAARLRVAPKTVRGWLRAGKLAGFTIGRRKQWRIPGASVRRFEDTGGR